MKRVSPHVPRVLFIGVWANRHWILGNWIKELAKSANLRSRIIWVLSAYTQNSLLNKLPLRPLPQADFYFFSHIGIFKNYSSRFPDRFENKSAILYTHDEGNLGSPSEQAATLNKAYRVHFNCSSDATRLMSAGLLQHKVRVVLGAVDENCKPLEVGEFAYPTIVLASRFSKRKGLGILPEVVSSLPNWHFLILGRGWKKFLRTSGLINNSRVQYEKFNFLNRNKLMPKAQIFLSLSSLEGGPIPLLEAMRFGLIPVVTNTGFAKDIITPSIDGIILELPIDSIKVVEAIKKTSGIAKESLNRVNHLTWDRMRGLLIDDLNHFESSKNAKWK